MIYWEILELLSDENSPLVLCWVYGGAHSSKLSSAGIVVNRLFVSLENDYFRKENILYIFFFISNVSCIVLLLLRKFVLFIKKKAVFRHRLLKPNNNDNELRITNYYLNKNRFFLHWIFFWNLRSPVNK